MENGGYLLAAFGLIWAVVFGYIVFIQHKQKKLERQISILKEAADKSDR